MKNPFFLLLDEQIFSNIYAQISPLLYKIYIKYQRTECSHVQRTIQIQKVHRRQLPPPERGSSPLPWDSIEPEAKETSIHKASKQQMASTGNLPLKRLHCCLHIFLNPFCLYQNACLFLARSTQKRQRKAKCKVEGAFEKDKRGRVIKLVSLWNKV